MRHFPLPSTIRTASRWRAALALPLTLAAALAAPVGPVRAAPTVWSAAEGGNGHAYAFVDASTDWVSARSAALAMSDGGVQGHLATVTSAAENDFLGRLAADGWLDGSDADQEGVWRWMDGAEAGQTFWLGGADGTATGYASWYAGEPNNLGDEDYLHRLGGSWNDYPGWRTLGYYVEYDLPPAVAQVPEPGALLLAATGLLALAGVARRRAHPASPAPRAHPGRPAGRLALRGQA